MERVTKTFEVGENSFEIRPLENEYHYELFQNGRSFELLNGIISTAFNPPKIRFQCTGNDYRFAYEKIAIEDAICILEKHYNSN